MIEIRDGKKQCSNCEEWLDLEEFGRLANGPGGRASWCKACKRKAQASSLHFKKARAPRPFAGRRSCLRCGRPFDSEGPGNRICGGCVGVNAYAAPAPMRNYA